MADDVVDYSGTSDSVSEPASECDCIQWQAHCPESETLPRARDPVPDRVLVPDLSGTAGTVPRPRFPSGGPRPVWTIMW
jgi:hypothetical protein